MEAHPMAISHSTSHRGQALVELAVGMFALTLLVSTLCGFAVFIAKSLSEQNHERVGGADRTAF